MSLSNGIEAALAASSVKLSNSKPLIYSKMTAVMKDIGAIGKDQKNQAQGFKFRGIDQFVNALYPALTKHGVFMAPRAKRYEQQLQEVTRASGKTGVDKHVSIEMEYEFYAEDGSSVVIGPIPAEGLDSGDKATNKALSAALKYALIQTFSIPTEDMAEADLESPEMGTPAAKAPVAAPAAPSSEALKKHLIAQAQVAVAQKKTTREDLLSLLGQKNGTITDAINNLPEKALENLKTKLEGIVNGK